MTEAHQNRPAPAPHRLRAIRPLGERRVAGWTLKRYGIREGGERPDARLLEAAVELASARLPRAPLGEDRYGIGLLIVHQARLFDTVLVDWWERDNELRHHVFRSRPGALRFEDVTASGEAFCVWELRVLGFERDAWIRHVARRSPEPDWDGYLAAALDEDC